MDTMIGMGATAEGLFIIGVTTNEQWEAGPDGDVFKHRLPVAWARVIYDIRACSTPPKALASRV